MLKRYKDIILLVFSLLIIFQIYLYTTYPAFKGDDSPETITAAYTLGISHPPAYPLHTMAAKIFTLIPVGSPAFRVNIFSIFLGMLVLFVVYFIIKQNMLLLFGYEHKIIIYFAIFIFAFSYIFWNQSLEAKGGIYILNLLFFSLLLYLCLKLINTFDIKIYYLSSFIFGLSLSNHWPSMIIVLPVFGYFYLKERVNIGKKHIIIMFALFLIGLTPYLYLPLRAMCNPVLNLGNPVTWSNFWWVILRAGYIVAPVFSFDAYKYQIKEFINLFIGDFSIMWVLMFLGAYIIYKIYRKIFYLYLFLYAIIAFFNVLYNHTEKELIWVIDNFLVPAQFIAFVFIVVGIMQMQIFLKQKMFKYGFLVVILIVIGFMGYKHHKVNTGRYNYIAYDFGNNILNTMEKDSVYLGEGDYFLMPVLYLQNIKKFRTDVKFIPAAFLPFQWGIDYTDKKYGNIQMKEYDLENNVANVINYFKNNSNIYTNSDMPIVEKIKLPFNFEQKGLLQKFTQSNEKIGSNIMDLYSIARNLGNIYIQFDNAGHKIILNYQQGLKLQGDRLMQKGMAKDAILLYKKALSFPAKDINADIYYNLSKAYKVTFDTYNELHCLKKVLEDKPDFMPAILEAGIIYYREKLFPLARAMFVKAKSLDANNNNINLIDKYLKSIDSVNSETQNEQIMKEATDLLAKSNDYNKAMELFDYLIYIKFHTEQIYENIGVYYFKNNNFEEALKYYEKSKEAVSTPEIYMYIAYTYYKMNFLDKALDVLKQGMRIYNSNQQMTQLYGQLEQVKKHQSGH
jgi:tetratricopeptide (TPR) repeat protein